MPLYVLRLKNANLVIVEAHDERGALNITRSLGCNSEICTIRCLGAFAAQFVLSDLGELSSTLFDLATLNDLHCNEYPMLKQASAMSYDDFDTSQSDSRESPVLYDRQAREHKKAWAQRDRQLITHAVKRERQRFSN